MAAARQMHIPRIPLKAMSIAVPFDRAMPLAPARAGRPAGTWRIALLISMALWAAIASMVGAILAG